MLTPEPDLDLLLTGYARTLDRVLDGFVGLYLVGSLAIGDFDGSSDVDLVVVTEEEQGDAAMAAFVEAYGALRRQGTWWARRLDHSLWPRARLVTPSSPFHETGRNDLADRLLWWCNGDEPVRSDHDNTLVTRWVLQERGVPVAGPDPSCFGLSVTPEALRTEIRTSLLGWRREDVYAVGGPHHNRFHQAFFVLNQCRALQDLHEGRITSKREGVVWAKANLVPRWHALIDHCWHERQDPGIHVSQPADPDVYAEVLAFVEHGTELARRFGGR